MTDEPDQTDEATGPPEPRLETKAVTAGRASHGSALAAPLWATSTFTQQTVEEGKRLASTPLVKNFYSRYGNPTVEAFEDAVAELEGAEAALGFGSGMGAISSVVLALCSAGNHVVAQTQLYTQTSMLFQAVLPRFGIEVTFVDATDAGAFADAVRPGTSLLYAETPTNPCLQLVDLEAVGAITGPIKVVDSTFGGPLIQRPLDHGFDVVIHSATKSLAGHNDATLGVAAGERELLQWIWGYHTIHGAAASPFDAWNALRGIRTLGVRVRQQSASAQRVAEFLEQHPAVSRVNYPGLDSHPQRELAKRQMAMGGGILSFDLAGGLEAGRRFVESCELAHLAPSLGGPETLVTHPGSTTAAGLGPDDRELMGIGDGLVRMSVGLEHPDDIVADIARALAVD